MLVELLRPIHFRSLHIATALATSTRKMTTAPTSLQSKLAALHQFTACDVSDALFKLQKVPAGQTVRAGFLADLHSLTLPLTTTTKTIAPASTFQFIPKSGPAPPAPSPQSSIPPGTHWVDHAAPQTVVVVAQPPGQHCAAVGGIMAARMAALGVRGLVVGGRVRDVGELRRLKVKGVKEEGEGGKDGAAAAGGGPFPVYARATSTVGTGAEAKPWAREVPVDVGGVVVSPGDIMFCDPVEGIVVIPAGLLDEVLGLMPKLVEADDKVMADVDKGVSVFEAFQKHRGRL